MNNITTIKKLLFMSILALCGTLTLSACNKNDTTQTSSEDITSNKTIALDSAQMMIHLNALQEIANKNGGNRAVGTKGGKASAEYIINQAKKVGFNPKILQFKNRENVVGQNIIVEIPGENKDSAIIVGAHYDSVKTGPGINDNGSGVALVLELMNQLSQEKTKSKNTIYLAFWDSEEVGIAGSNAFVKTLSTDQIKNIKAYINVDMVGTKDPTILIADADKSSVDEMEKILKERGMNAEDYQPLLNDLRSIPSHPDDLALENISKAFFKKQNLVIKEDVSTLTASDTLPFLGKVPVTSIILFHEQMKGNELEFAPCYHKACDTIDQVDPKSLVVASNAVLYLIQEINAQK